MRSKIFRQVVQINQGKADALPRFFGQADGIIFKQAVRLELCGVALKLLNPDNQVICAKGSGVFNVLRHFEDNRKVDFFLFFILTTLQKLIVLH